MVADFPHHDDAGRLPQRGSQRQGKIGRIAVQFALVYRRSLVLVQKFDRIFHRQDVIAIFAVDRVDQRGQRRGLARPRASRHQNDPAAYFCGFFQLRRQPKRVECWNRGRNDAHHNRATSALDEYVDAEAGHSRQSIGDVARTLLAKRTDCLLVIADQVGGDASRVVRRKRAASRHFYPHQLSVNLDLGRSPGRKNQVADLLRHAQHAGQQHRGWDGVRPTDAIEGNCSRGTPRSSHFKHSQLIGISTTGEKCCEAGNLVLTVTRMCGSAKDN